MSGKDENPNPRPARDAVARRRRERERVTNRNEDFAVFMLFAVIISLSFLGGMGFTLMITSDTPSDIYDDTIVQEVLIEELIIPSYVMINGTFDSVDVYTWDMVGEAQSFKLHAHIEESGVKYPIDGPEVEQSDYRKLGYYFSRVSVCIVINGTYTEYEFKLVWEKVYNLTFEGLDFEFLLWDDLW